MVIFFRSINFHWVPAGRILRKTQRHAGDHNYLYLAVITQITAPCFFYVKIIANENESDQISREDSFQTIPSLPLLLSNHRPELWRRD